MKQFLTMIALLLVVFTGSSAHQRDMVSGSEIPTHVVVESLDSLDSTAHSIDDCCVSHETAKSDVHGLCGMVCIESANNTLVVAVFNKFVELRRPNVPSHGVISAPLVRPPIYFL